MRHPGSRMSMPVPPPGSRCKQFELLLPLFSTEGLRDDESLEAEALREHLESCAYCRTVLALYDVQTASLRRSHSERIAASPSFTDDIFSRIEEVPVVSRLPEHSTSEPGAATPLLHTNSTYDGTDIARRRIEAARLAMHPPKKRAIVGVAAWVSPLVAVALIAVLVAALLSAHHAGRSVAIAPYSLPYAPSVGFEITAMSMTSPGEGWAIVTSVVFDQNASMPPQYLLHDHEGTWSTVRLATTAPLTDISMVSPTDGWAVSSDGSILHYDGRDWTPAISPTDAQLLSIRMLSATNGWASGVSRPASDAPLILHYDGHQWTIQSTPSLALAPATWPEMLSTPSIQPEPDGEVWAQATWQLLLNGSVPLGPPPPNLTGSAILRYNGQQWQVQTSIPGVLLGGLSMDSAQDGWVMGISEPADTQQNGGSGREVFYHYSHGRWELTPLTLPSSGGATVSALYGKLDMVSPGNGWMLGTTTSSAPAGWALHLSQGRLQLATLPTLPTPHGWELDGLYFQPDGSGWIFGMASKTITRKGKASFISWVPLMLRYAGGTWSIQLD